MKNSSISKIRQEISREEEKVKFLPRAIQLIKQAKTRNNEKYAYMDVCKEPFKQPCSTVSLFKKLEPETYARNIKGVSGTKKSKSPKHPLSTDKIIEVMKILGKAGLLEEVKDPFIEMGELGIAFEDNVKKGWEYISPDIFKIMSKAEIGEDINSIEERIVQILLLTFPVRRQMGNDKELNLFQEMVKFYLKTYWIPFMENNLKNSTTFDKIIIDGFIKSDNTPQEKEKFDETNSKMLKDYNGMYFVKENGKWTVNSYKEEIQQSLYRSLHKHYKNEMKRIDDYFLRMDKLK